MSEFRLEDFWAIIQGIFIFGFLLFGGMALIALWPKIRLLISATRHRYIRASWNEMALRIADERTRHAVIIPTKRGVKHLRAAVLKKQARNALKKQPDYVKSEPNTGDTNTPIPVLGTGIGVDTRHLAETLTEAQRLEIMALAKKTDGKWAHSGKKLFTAFGGNYNEFVATMRRLRGGTEDDPMEEPTIYTPIAGRPTKASYYDDPRLEYQAPPQ